MTIFLLICATLGCVAWVVTERELSKERRHTANLERQNARLTQTNHSYRLLLGDAINALPEKRRGRQPGEPIRYSAWEQRKQDRLVSHLQLCDEDAS